MAERRRFQRYLLVVAIVSYVAAAACAVAAGLMRQDYEDPVFASLLASVIFFAGVGVVLHVIASTNLPDLRQRDP